MKKMPLILASGILVSFLLVACGPSEEELAMTATRVAADAFATQTARAPTATFTPTATPTPTPTLTPTPTPTQPSPLAILEAAVDAMNASGSYHFEMEMEMGMEVGGSTISFPFTFSGDFQEPDMLQATMEMNILGTAIETEMITIGETSYVQNPLTGAWEQETATGSPVDPGGVAQADPDDIADLTYLGETELDGVRVHHLGGTLDPEALDVAGGELAVEYWIGVEDSLIYRAEVEGEILVDEEDGIGEGTVTMSMVMLFSDYGQEIEIVAPELPEVPELGTLLFADDFSDPASGWDQVRQADRITDYEDGAYRIFVDVPNLDLWANPGRSFADVQVEVTATKVGGSDDNDFGVICRYQDLDNFYYFIISSDGFFAVVAVIDGEHLPVGLTFFEQSGTINQGDATNEIRADCIGDRLALYVNGQQVFDGQDDRLTSGDVGLIAGTFGEPGTDIRFDDFAVYEPE